MPDWKHYVRKRLPPLALGAEREAEIVAELAQHLEAACEEARTGGATEAEARAAAKAHFHDWRVLESELVRAERSVPVAAARGWRDWNDRIETRQTGAGKMFADLWQDIRYGLRTLRKSPGFTAVAVLTLALGIGANTAIFSVVNGVLLRPLPFPDFDRLVTLEGVEHGRSGARGTSQPDYNDFRAQNESLEEMGLVIGWTFNLTEREVPERITGSRCSGALFSVLGAKAMLGRTLLPADDVPGTNHVVISYGLWQRAFGGDPGVLEQAIQLNGMPHTIVGVMPASFQFPTPQADLWGTIEGNFGGSPRTGRFLQAVARLKPGVSLETAQADLSTIAARLEQSFPDTNKDWGVRVTPLLDSIVLDVRSTLWLLFAMVGFVLLIACANVANLLLARMASRRKEIAVRSALGARRGRLLQQLLTENLLLASLGGLLALLLARGGMNLMNLLRPEDLPRLSDVYLDGPVFVFALLLSVLAGGAVGMLPALQLTRKEHNEALKEGGRTTTQSEGQRRLRGALVVAELALALMLLIGGGLLLRSFERVLSVPPGFNPEQLLTLNVFLTPPKYRAVAPQKAFVQQAAERIRTVPGIVGVSTTTHPPFGDTSTGMHFAIEGRETGGQVDPIVEYRAVSPGYFQFMRIPIRRGRALRKTDNESSQLVVVINQAMVNRFFPDEDPLGKRIRWTQYGSEQGWHTIVAVAGNVQAHGLEGEAQPAAYAPYRQRNLNWMRWTTFVVRYSGDSRALAPAVRRAIH